MFLVEHFSAAFSWANLDVIVPKHAWSEEIIQGLTISDSAWFYENSQKSKRKEKDGKEWSQQSDVVMNIKLLLWINFYLFPLTSE